MELRRRLPPAFDIGRINLHRNMERFDNTLVVEIIDVTVDSRKLIAVDFEDDGPKSETIDQIVRKVHDYFNQRYIPNGT